MKKFIKQALFNLGYEIINVKKQTNRRIGSMEGLLKHLKARGLPCNSILDVGANTGAWSRLAKKIFTEANIFLIEPQIEMKDKLDNFCNEYPGSVYLLAGAGAKSGNLTFTVWDDLAGSSFLPKPDLQLIKSNKQREVQVITIDELIQTGKLNMPAIVKMDIQGFELEALKGASSLFGITDVFIIEVSMFSFDEGMPDFSDMIRFMLENDYVAYDFPGFLRRPLDGALGQCDVCFVKRNGILRSSNKWSR